MGKNLRHRPSLQSAKISWENPENVAIALDKREKNDIIYDVTNIGVSPSGKATDSDSVIT